MLFVLFGDIGLLFFGGLCELYGFVCVLFCLFVCFVFFNGGCFEGFFCGGGGVSFFCFCLFLFFSFFFLFFLGGGSFTQFLFFFYT